MNLKIKNYLEQEKVWPQSGKHIMAQYTDEYVVVYQAYRPKLGLYAAKHQYFGGDYSYTRMSWIKPNFLWMMYRSGWGTKEGQEVVLAIYLKRDYFDKILRTAYPSSNIMGLPQAEFSEQVKLTDVRLQWDPDHGPHGEKLDRRAIQLGLRNEFLQPFKGDGIVKIEDISDFVAQQYAFVQAGRLDELMTPEEHVFEVDEDIRANLFMN